MYRNNQTMITSKDSRQL